MKISVQRKAVRFTPSPDRVIFRTLHYLNARNLKEKRTISILSRVLNLSEKETSQTLQYALKEFSMQHRNIIRAFTKNFLTIKPFDILYPFFGGIITNLLDIIKVIVYRIGSSLLMNDLSQMKQPLKV